MGLVGEPRGVFLAVGLVLTGRLVFDDRARFFNVLGSLDGRA